MTTTAAAYQEECDHYCCPSGRARPPLLPTRKSMTTAATYQEEHNHCCCLPGRAWPPPLPTRKSTTTAASRQQALPPTAYQ